MPRRKLVLGARRRHAVALLAPAWSLPDRPQQPLTWDHVRTKLETTNPALRAHPDNVDEMMAEEIRAFLRRNPQFKMLADSSQITPHVGTWAPSGGKFEQPNSSYLHERDQKCDLRLESAQKNSRITQSQHELEAR